jgi:ABC-type thiamine transport system substrate-binding protein
MERKRTMPIFRTALWLAILLAISNQSFAQTISTDYQKNCVSEQVAEHKDLKGKTLSAEDFTAYCTCQAEFINKNATNRQVNELAINPKAKPEWLKAMEARVMKACIAADPKITT